MNSTLITDGAGSDVFSSTFLFGNVGAPFVIGLAVGFFAKKMLLTALFLGGAAVVLLFAGEYYGVVDITDSALQSAADSATRVAHDSGGFLVNRLSTITTRGVSAVGGFFLGFKLG